MDDRAADSWETFPRGPSSSRLPTDDGLIGFEFDRPWPMEPTDLGRTGNSAPGRSQVAEQTRSHRQTASRPRPSRSVQPQSGQPQPGQPEPGRTAKVPVVIGLIAILTVQAVLSIRLIRGNTAYQDEAMYLWAGHLMWAHWLHGAAIPPFQAYFGGAPVLYPPIGAIADGLGGLEAARGLSLAMMLGVTSLLWTITRRLYGQRAAFFAAGLFAVAGPVLLLGAFAACDSLSLLLLAIAAWCAVRAGQRSDATGWMIAGGIALALANAAQYTSLVLDPVVVLLAVLVAYPKPGGKSALGRGATMLTMVLTLLMIGILVGGTYYVTGADLTLSPAAYGSGSAATTLAKQGIWTGTIVALALCGVAAAWFGKSARQRWLITLLAAAALIVPTEQVILGMAPTLGNFAVPGIFFAAMAAGFGVDWLCAAVKDRTAQVVVTGAFAVALAFPAIFGAHQSKALATSWPNSGSFTAILGPLIDGGDGHLLIEDPRVAEYYLPSGKQWARWSSTWDVHSSGRDITADSVATPGSPAEFKDLISDGYFSVVALNFADTTALDHRLEQFIKANPHYHIAEVVPYGQGPYVIWRWEISTASQGYQPDIGSHHPKRHAKARHHKSGRTHGSG
jgi:Dolichyl-phosphate-mannose-protein mannosyltransferase